MGRNITVTANITEADYKQIQSLIKSGANQARVIKRAQTLLAFHKNQGCCQVSGIIGVSPETV